LFADPYPVTLGGIRRFVIKRPVRIIVEKHTVLLLSTYCDVPLVPSAGRCVQSTVAGAILVGSKVQMICDRPVFHLKDCFHRPEIRASLVCSICRYSGFIVEAAVTV